MMKKISIDEVIEHCERKVKKIEKMFKRTHLESEDCFVADLIYKEYWGYRQVAEWLNELKCYRKE